VLGAGQETSEDISLTAAAPGVYWLGGCVEAVNGDNNESNNCGSAVQVTVLDRPEKVGGKAALPAIMLLLLTP
jgi:hypothetical protein